MTHEELTRSLVYPLFRGIPDAYKVRYARTIWQQLEDNIRSAARCSTLSAFLDKISRRLAIEIRGEDKERLAAVITSGDDRRILKNLREHATTLVLLARIMNEKRRNSMEETTQ